MQFKLSTKEATMRFLVGVDRHAPFVFLIAAALIGGGGLGSKV